MGAFVIIEGIRRLFEPPGIGGKIMRETVNVPHGHAATILADLQRCVAEHLEVSLEHSTFEIEPTAHRDQESMPH